jgi:septal ring factor EnvC (AmiA/AmiB activator)
LDVAERFALRPSKIGWLPLSLVPILAIVLLLVEPATKLTASSTTKATADEIAQVKKVAAQLKKRIEQQRRKADSEDLKEAKEMFERMEADLDKITKREDLDRKDAMIAMNDLKKELEERRGQLGSSEQMRKALSQMKGLQAGPAEKVAKSIEKGDFGQAKDMVKQLASKIRDGKLSEKDKEQLKKQVEQMKKEMEKAVAEHEQQKKDLQRQIDQARREGKGAEAAMLQQELNQMQQKDAQMQSMKQMAEAMNQAAQAMEQGNAAEAADALEQMAEQLGDMQAEMSELEDLQSAMDDLSQLKNQMRCQNCGGAGCQSCQGGFGNGDGQGEGNGLGRGSGAGDRPEEEGETNSYETQIRGNVKKGKAIIAGFADGPNRKGVSQEDLKHAIESALSEDSDPLENQSLPRTEREHATDYFNRLREGK